jgi:hypothetical protein
MLSRSARRVGAGAVAVFAAMALTAVPAGATPLGQTSLGQVDVTRAGHAVTVPPIAQCDVTADQNNSSNGTHAYGVASFGAGSTTCTKDAGAKTAKMQATGNGFDLTALVPYGGPEIKLSDYSAGCVATTTSTTANFQFSGLQGVTAPKPIPANYTTTVGPADNPQARVTFNEVIQAQPNDGSVTINMLHIQLFPNGDGPMSGEIIVGHAACSPVS